MKNRIGVGLIGAVLSVAPFSDIKAENFLDRFSAEISSDSVKKELFQTFDKNNFGEIGVQGIEKSEMLLPIDTKIIIDAALSYFDEEVKLYSLKGEARENVKVILQNYLSSHPILRKNSDGEILFIIDNKPAFASMIKNLANTLFDGMPSVIRKIAIFIAFGGNEELQRTLNNLDSTVMNLAPKQYKDIVFDYFGGIVKRVSTTIGGEMKVGDYYNKVNEYYPNKNHDKILKELNNTGQINTSIVNLKYPFKK